jgi:tetratricopeptide (TPR) repeat protein
MRRRLSHLWVLAVGLLLAAPVVAHAQRPEATEAKGEESLDSKAKRLFAAGHYSEAIEILAQLYAKTNNPIYLRNIGRCYQRLPDPDRAIASFEEYLLRGRNISRSEREEVRGFIRDLQEQKRRNAETAAPAESARPSTPAPPPAVVQPTVAPVAIPTPAAPPPVEPAAIGPTSFAPVAPPPADNVAATAPQGRRLGRTLAIVAMGLAGGLAVGGAVVMATSWSRYKSAEKTCLIRANCGEAAKTVESRNNLAKVLLIGAGVTGAAGVTVYLIDPGRRGDSGVALGVGGRF